MSFAHGHSSHPIYKKWLPLEFMYHIQAICKLPMLSYYNVNIGLNDLPSHARKTIIPSNPNELRFYSLVIIITFKDDP